MAITKVWIEEGCISCGLCSEICPAVFVMNDEAHVVEESDFTGHEALIINAAEECPVEVIKYA